MIAGFSSLYKVAGTGHRPNKLGGYSAAAVTGLIDFAEREINTLKTEIPNICVISGMALGWDQALATAAIRNQIPLIAAVPFKGQEKAWPWYSRVQYLGILEKADHIVIVSEGEYSSEKMQIRNEWMVNQCDLVLALWDGSPGGTSNCIRYARDKKPIKNVWQNFNKKV